MHRTTSGPSGNLAEQPVGRSLWSSVREFGWGSSPPRRVQTHRPRVSDLLVSIVYCGLFVGRSCCRTGKLLRLASFRRCYGGSVSPSVVSPAPALVVVAAVQPTIKSRPCLESPQASARRRCGHNRGRSDPRTRNRSPLSAIPGPRCQFELSRAGPRCPVS